MRLGAGIVHRSGGGENARAVRRPSAGACFLLARKLIAGSSLTVQSCERARPLEHVRSWLLADVSVWRMSALRGGRSLGVGFRPFRKSR
jgi:hypothetical protein